MENEVVNINTSKFNCDRTLETLFRIFNGIQDQIKFADTKASFVLAFITAMLAFISSRLNIFTTNTLSNWILSSLSIIGYATAALAIVFSLLSIISRFGVNAPQTKVFFKHINDNYKKDYERYINDLKMTTNENWLEEISSQIVEVSGIATKKHLWVKRAIIFSMTSIITWVLIFGLNIFLFNNNILKNDTAKQKTITNVLKE